MKIITKNVVCALLLMFMVLNVLVGCRKQENSGEHELMAPEGMEYREPSEKVVMEKIHVWTDNAHEKNLRLQQIEKFNNTVGKSKGIEIVYTVYGSNYQSILKEAARRGKAPELFRPTGTLLTDFVKAGYVIPITDLPGGEVFVHRYEENLVNNQHVFNEKVYTVPYNLTTYKLIVNDDLFEKAGITEYPKTWDDLRKAAKQITETSNKKAYGMVLGLQSDWTISTYLIRPNGTNVGHVGFNHETMQFEFSAFSPVIEAVKGMADDGSLLPGSEGLDANAARAQFAEGRIGMVVGASFDTGVYFGQFPTKFNWSVVPLPSFTSEEPPYKEFADATNLLGIGQAALEKKEKTMEVLKFLYSDENAAEMYENSLYIPFRQEAINLASKEPAQKGFADFAYVPNKVLMLPLPDTIIHTEGDGYRETIANIFTDKVDRSEIKAVLSDLDRRYNVAFDRLPMEVRKEYEQTKDVLDNFKKDSIK